MAKLEQEREPNVRVVVVLRAGSSKQEIHSPEPLPRSDAEEAIGEIGKAREKQAEIKLPWLAASGAEVIAAYIEIDPDDPQPDPRSFEEIIAALEKKGITFRPKTADD